MILVGVGHDVPTAVAAARHARELRRADGDGPSARPPLRLRRTAGSTTTAPSPRPCPELGVVPYIRNAQLHRRPARRTRRRLPERDRREVRRARRRPLRRLRPGRGLDRFVWVAGLAEPYAPVATSPPAPPASPRPGERRPGRLAEHDRSAARPGTTRRAMKVWEQIRRFEELRAADGSANNVTVVKEALASLGLCRREVRPPSRDAARGRSAPRSPPIAAGWSIVDARGRTGAPRRAAKPPVVRQRDGPALLQPPRPRPASSATCPRSTSASRSSRS